MYYLITQFSYPSASKARPWCGFLNIFKLQPMLLLIHVHVYVIPLLRTWDTLGITKIVRCLRFKYNVCTQLYELCIAWTLDIKER